MYHYRQALVRMRLGDSDRQIAKAECSGSGEASQYQKGCVEIAKT